MSNLDSQIKEIQQLVHGNLLNKAEKTLIEMMKKNPNRYELHNILGVIYVQKEKFEEAVKEFEKSIELNEKFSNAYNNLGGALYKLSKFRRSANICKKAIEIDPNSAQAYNNLAANLIFLENFDEAIKYFKKSIQINPNQVDANINIGNLLKNRGQAEESFEYFLKAIDINPKIAKNYNDYGMALKKISKFDGALNQLNKALEINPNFFYAYINIGNILKNRREHKKAIENFEKAKKINPNLEISYSNILFTSNYFEDFKIKDYLNYAKKLRSIYKKINDSKISPYIFEKKPRKLNIGFISGNFNNHSVGHFLLDVVRELREKNINTFAYNNNNFNNDEQTDKFKKYFNKWNTIFDKDDLEILNLIRDDKIHVLIDLAGHTEFSKLSIFLNKPAPIQATWLGYNGSTGIPEIDYCIGDKIAFPNEIEKRFVEKIWHLPEVMQCLSKPDFDLKIESLPVIKNKFLTFGSFNNPAKITDKVILTWSKILNSIKDSKILLKSNYYSDPFISNSILEKFIQNKVEKKRIIFEKGSKTRKEILETYNKIDISLDTFPYNGVTTSHESIWMGVPVLTKSGSTPHSRMGKSLNQNIKMEDWTAKNEQDYVKKAIKLSKDINKLSIIRKTIRKELLKTSSFNSKIFASHLEEAFWLMWKKFNEKSSK